MVKEIWVGQSISGYTQHIMSTAPDPNPVMALLLFILSFRHWYGDWKGWTQVPITWLAKKWQTSFYRIKDALTWLETQKMIISCQTNPDTAHSGRAGWYKIVEGGIRKTIEEEEVEEKISQQDAKNRLIMRKHSRQKTLRATPKAEGDIPTVPVVFWSPMTSEIVWENRPAEYAASLEKCKRCGGVFDPIIGVHPNHPTICVQCYILETAVPGESLTIELDFNTYEWDAETVDKFLESVKNS